MIKRVKAFFNRPLAEDFSWQTQGWLSLQAGFYVFLFLTVFNTGAGGWVNRVAYHALFGLGCAATSWLANTLMPRLLPGWYDEDRWTVGRHAGHVLVVLLFVSVGNSLLLLMLNLGTLPFWKMYAMVTVIGFVPVFLGVMLAERRRLTRNLAQARQLNAQLDQLHRPVSLANVPEPTGMSDMPKGVVLASETGTERLSLLPNQFVYAESVGNYVEVHWLNFMFPQKTSLRSTLKDVEAALAHDPQFFRCHRAFIVNLRAVSHTTGNSRGYQLTMSGSSREIPVSRAYLAAFDARMKALV